MNALAIVGIDCAYGGGQDLEDFARHLYEGASFLPVSNPDLSVAAIGARLLAATDARLRVGHGGETAPLRWGAIVCSAQDAAAKARALAAPDGAAASKSAGLGDHDFQTALQMAEQWLVEVDLVLVMGEDSLGIGAVLLASADRICGGTVYARLEASAATGSEPAYLEVGSWPPPSGLLAAYAAPAPDLGCAVGSLAAAGLRSPLAALIKAVLALHRRTLYPSPASGAPGGDWASTPFYSVPRTRPWFSPSSLPRRADIAYQQNGIWTRLQVVEPGPDRRDVAVRERLLSQGAGCLVPVAGAGGDEILAGLASLRQALSAGEDLAGIARQTVSVYADHPEAAYALALVGHSREELLKEVDFAVDGVRKAFQSGSRRHDWQTPRGSAFTAKPLGGDGVAFVYPGAFNAYVGLAQDLFQHFPKLHEWFTSLTHDLGARLAERFLYPRERVCGQESEAERWEVRLRNHPVSLIESGAMVAAAHTALLRDLFGVQPRMALGYSLGEVSMLWAAGVWQEADRGSEAFSSSQLFRDRVVGPKLAIREHWNLTPGEPMTWVSYLLKAPVEKVRDAIVQEPRVYLTLINLADEVVIGGEAAACRRVVEALDCHALEVPYDVAIHNDAIQSEYDALRALYTHRVFADPEFAFYSTADYAPVVVNERALAEAMATMSCHPVDFPRMVQRVYEDGARVFVELGPLGTCTRRIKRILKGAPHAAVAMNPSPGSDYDGVLGVLALLIAHRVPVDLSVCFDGADAETSASGSLVLEPALAATAAHPGGIEAPVVPGPSGLGPAALTPEVEGARPESARALHRAFLDSRSAAQHGAGSVIGLQVAASGAWLGRLQAGSGAAAFDEAALREFAAGDVVRCFGDDYARYRGRRVPRIPNGDLQLMSRVVAINGEPGGFDGGPELWSEFDMPQRAWFDVGGGRLPPHVALMEMALQPCGFLSAYLRSPMLLPDADLYFRNLGGEARILAEPDLRGKPVTNHVRLTSSTRAQGVILQTFTFAMACEGRPFYEGTSSFGFFPRAAMLRQAAGAAAPFEAPRYLPEESGPAGVIVTEPVPYQLQLLHRMRAEPAGGRYGKGYVRGEGQVTPWDWFFKAHFYEDPVMPGSLGVEAAAQALRAFGRWRMARADSGPDLASAIGMPARGGMQVWKYRGQIAPPGPGHRGAWSVDVHVAEVHEALAGAVVLTGDVEVWREGGEQGRVRIYEINGLSVGLHRGER